MKPNRKKHGVDLFWDAALNNNVADLSRYVAAEIDVNAADRYGMTALHKAALTASWNAVKYLLKIPRVDLFKRDNDGKTPLALAREFGNDTVAVAIETEANRRKRRSDRKQLPPYSR